MNSSTLYSQHAKVKALIASLQDAYGALSLKITSLKNYYEGNKQRIIEDELYNELGRISTSIGELKKIRDIIYAKALAQHNLEIQIAAGQAIIDGAEYVGGKVVDGAEFVVDKVGDGIDLLTFWD